MKTNYPFFFKFFCAHRNQHKILSLNMWNYSKFADIFSWQPCSLKSLNRVSCTHKQGLIFYQMKKNYLFFFKFFCAHRNQHKILSLNMWNYSKFAVIFSWQPCSLKSLNAVVK